MPTTRNITYKESEKNGKSSKKDMKRPVGIMWDKLSYKEMIMQLDKLTGAQPQFPEDITFPKWSSQAIRVLEERYFKKDIHGKPVETVQEMCWRVAWEIARAEAKYGKK